MEQHIVIFYSIYNNYRVKLRLRVIIISYTLSGKATLPRRVDTHNRQFHQPAINFNLEPPANPPSPSPSPPSLLTSLSYETRINCFCSVEQRIDYNIILPFPYYPYGKECKTVVGGAALALAVTFSNCEYRV